MQYVIECEGVLYGPFETDLKASEYARTHCAPPWRLRTIHIVPPHGRRIENAN